MKNLRMFKKLCGDRGLGSLVLATTMWSMCSAEVGRQREVELINQSDFWKYMIEKGSKVFRHDQVQHSALAIVNYLIDKWRAVTLDIQHDMVDRGLKLSQTAAGMEVQDELVRLREQQEQEIQVTREEMKDAMAQEDREWQREMEEYKAEIEQKMTRDQQDIIKMQADREDLRMQMNKQHKEEVSRLMAEIQQVQKKLDLEMVQMKVLTECHKRDLEIQKLRLKLEKKKVQPMVKLCGHVVQRLAVNGLGKCHIFKLLIDFHFPMKIILPG